MAPAISPASQLVTGPAAGEIDWTDSLVKVSGSAP